MTKRELARANAEYMAEARKHIEKVDVERLTKVLMKSMTTRELQLALNHKMRKTA